MLLWRVATTALLVSLAALYALASPPGLGSETGARDGYVTTPDGVKIHYLEAGTGPALLFVPGWMMPAWIWEHQIEEFSRTYRVVAMDPRSQGESDKPAHGHHPAARARDIRAVVESLELAPAVLVGWSMGVMEAVAYVDEFGTDSLAALVFVDGYAGGDFDPVDGPQVLKWAHSFQLDRRRATDAFVRGLYATPGAKDDEEDIRRLVDTALKTPTNSAMALILAYLATDLRPALARIDRPALIVVAQSPWIKYYEELHRLTPGSQMVVFDDVGHALFADDPARFNSLLKEFLGRLSAAN